MTPKQTPEIDPVSVSVFENRLNFISREMGIVMLRSSRSPIFNQSHDFSCYLTDPDGNLISQADGVPIHTGGGGLAVQSLRAYWQDDINEGDIFLMNDPYVAGGNHLPDFTVIAPVFEGDTLLAFACARAHQIDIGGGVAGTYNPMAREIYQEGIRIPAVKIYAGGRFCHDVVNLITLNTRFPELVSADMQSMVGAVRVGAKRLTEIATKNGTDMFFALQAAVLDYAERVVRKAIEDIPDGVYRGQDFMTNDGVTNSPVDIVVEITVSGSDVTVDFTGTSPQIATYKNSSYTNTCSAVYLAFATLLGGRIPLNSGSYRMISIHAPKGSLVNPRPPAPLTFCTHHPTYEIIHACWRAFGDIRPELVSAGWGKPCHPVSFGYELESDDLFVLFHMAAQPGAGAMVARDGFDQIGQLQSLGAITIPNLELYEQIYPVLFRQHEFRCDSGGAGTHRGGTGITYAVEFLSGSRHNLRGEGVGAETGFGIAGGANGSRGAVLMREAGGEEQVLPDFGLAEFGPGVLTVHSPGGGGWGDPTNRPRDAVEADLRGGLISARTARDLYGYDPDA